MAEAEIIITSLMAKLNILIEEEPDYPSLPDLRDALEYIEWCLKDADKKRRKSGSVVEVWVRQTTDFVYDAEDVIDAFMHHVEQLMTVKLEKLKKQIDVICTRAQKSISVYKGMVPELSRDSSNSRDEEKAWSRRNQPALEEYDMVGLQEESDQILNWLNEGAHQRKVFSITGMGGLGKTTLAQKIYNHQNVSSHFAARAWITVSKDFQVSDILRSTLKQLIPDDRSRLEKMDRNELVQELRKVLEEKRYLVVFDDIWDVQAWDQIILAFPNNRKQSRVILTTRIKEVALHADASHHNLLDLRPLDEIESWKLFRKTVFSRGFCPVTLVSLGHQIVVKCGGLPLAILVIGGLLKSKPRTHDAWSKINESFAWQLSQGTKDECRETLMLSYIDLPYYLKSCFLYLGGYPEDFEIDAKQLIRLWVAEGFVQARGHETLEDVAQDYLDELIQRSMVESNKRSLPNKILRVHDLLRELAILEARKDGILDVHKNVNGSTSSRRQRRLAIQFSEDSKPVTITPKVRSLLTFGPFPQIIFGHGIQMLRVLNMETTRFEEFPNEIGHLVFLHYLKLVDKNDGRTLKLPSSIGDLDKLQTLDCEGKYLIPKTIWKLKNLRHLLLDKHCEFEKVKIMALKEFGGNLQTLRLGSWRYEFIWRGMSDGLVKLSCLRSMEVRGLKISNDQNLSNCFPSSLTQLTLLGTHLEEEESLGVLGRLPVLQSLYLGWNSYTGVNWCVYSGQFPRLQELYLDGLIYLIDWTVDEGAMPMLMELQIDSCFELNKFPSGLRTISTLQRVTLQGEDGQMVVGKRS